MITDMMASDGMSSALTEIKHDNLPVQPQHDSSTQIIASDVLIPRLVLCQAQSEFVRARKAVAGDVVKSTTIQKVAAPSELLQVIPLRQTPYWIVECKKPGMSRFDWHSRHDRNARNDRLPWSFCADQNGNEMPVGSPRCFGEWRRVKALELFALLESDVSGFVAEMDRVKRGEAPDLSKALSPVVILFRSSSMHAGRAVVTHFTQAEQFKVQPYAYSFSLTCHEEKNDQGTFFVYDVAGTPKRVSDDMLPLVSYWYATVQSSSLLVDTVEADN